MMSADSTGAAAAAERSIVERSGGSSLQRLRSLLAASRTADSSGGAPEAAARFATDERTKKLEAALEQLPKLLQSAVVHIEERSRESLDELRAEGDREREGRLVNLEARLDEIAEQMRLWRATRPPTKSAGGGRPDVRSGRRFFWEAVLAAVLAASFLTVLWSLLGGAG